jgi:hypothetical protein
LSDAFVLFAAIPAGVMFALSILLCIFIAIANQKEQENKEKNFVFLVRSVVVLIVGGYI